MMPEFLSLVVGLSMYNATYIGEIVRSGFVSIPRGQTEAADSLGLPRHLTNQAGVVPTGVTRHYSAADDRLFEPV